jgi:putative transposase
MDAVEQVAPDVGTQLACDALGVPRASFYRSRKSAPAPRPKKPRPTPERALAPDERAEVLDLLHSPRFVDVAPAEVYATLLDQGKHLCSVRSMYRYLAAEGEVRERRNQLVHPHYAKPELLATAPNQVWSWDITKLRAAQKWTYYYLYVLLDIFSRYVVGWMLAHRESGELAARLVEETCVKQNVEAGQLVVHADRGSAPKSKSLAQMLTDLGVEASHSRPRVSNDNPFSESQFKTYKYQPEYPDRFGSYEHALSYSRNFFDWYCNHHRHSGIAMLTPADVHYGRAAAVLAERQNVLDAAYAAHPERFVKGPPKVPSLPQAVWINPPEDKTRSEVHLQ